MNKKWPNVILLSFSCLMAMSLWFSATAIAPIVVDEWHLTDGEAAWLTMSVQIGFAVGALLIALFNLADLIKPRVIYGIGCLFGALVNWLVTVTGDYFAIVIALRFLTGAALAAVYPVAMKILTTWMKSDRGLGLGILVGCLAIGSASPHFIRTVFQLSEWKPVLILSSLSTVLAAGLVLKFTQLGPYAEPVPPFRWRYILDIFKDRSIMQANMGYFGHMWELYAMWTWIAFFLLESFRLAPSASWIGFLGVEKSATMAAFATIAVGGLGSFAAGYLADRWGRSRTTILSMIISGLCAGTIGFFFGGNPTIVILIALIWGFAIVADSAQFSGAVSELCDKKFIGTALTLQTSIGFMLTIVSIRLIPVVVEKIGWNWAFTILVIGPIIGSYAMWKLKNSPAAIKLAGGRG